MVKVLYALMGGLTQLSRARIPKEFDLSFNLRRKTLGAFNYDYSSLAPHLKQYLDSSGRYSAPHLSHLVKYGP